MEKKKIIVNYKNSGVNTLKGFATFFFVIGGIFALGIMVYSQYDNDTAMIVPCLCAVIGSIAAGGLFVGLSSIAKTALYQRALLEEQYEFEAKTTTWGEPLPRRDEDEETNEK